MNVQPLNADQVLVTIKSVEETKVEISIQNENGDIVYYKQSSKPFTSFNKIFDVKNLENGNYSMKFNLNDLVMERELAISSDKICIGKADEYIAPFFALNKNQLVISHLNFGKEKYSLKIYNENGSFMSR